MLKHKEKLIIHATFTGYGHSILEPWVPAPYEEFDAINTLVKHGFPKERIVIRIDPIIPTEKGLSKALAVFKSFMDVGFSRFRVSVIDMYPHVRKRFEQANLTLPYGNNTFASKEQLLAVDKLLKRAICYWLSKGHAEKDLRIEACAEPGLSVPIQCGCISDYDLQLLGLNTDDVDSSGYQRKHCMCYSGKSQLLGY